MSNPKHKAATIQMHDPNGQLSRMGVSTLQLVKLTTTFMMTNQASLRTWQCSISEKDAALRCGEMSVNISMGNDAQEVAACLSADAVNGCDRVHELGNGANLGWNQTRCKALLTDLQAKYGCCVHDWVKRISQMTVSFTDALVKAIPSYDKQSSDQLMASFGPTSSAAVPQACGNGYASKGCTSSYVISFPWNSADQCPTTAPATEDSCLDQATAISVKVDGNHLVGIATASAAARRFTSDVFVCSFCCYDCEQPPMTHLLSKTMLEFYAGAPKPMSCSGVDLGIGVCSHRCSFL
jgi:hypothetical protein